MTERATSLIESPQGPVSLLIDYGEVISLPLPAESVAELANIAHVDVAEFESRYWRFRGDYDRGQSAATYWSAVLDRPTSATTVDALVTIDVAGWMHFDPATVAWISAQRSAGVPLWLLSNAPHELASAIEQSALGDLFDGLLFSSRLEVAKPSLECFSLAHAAIGGDPGNITFIDDRAENITAAAQYGMRTHLFVTPSQLPSADRRNS